MLAWIMTGAWVHGQSIWTIPNLLAYAFYGSRMYRPDFVSRTWSGLAFHFLFAAALGIVFALMLPRAFRPGSAAMAGAMYSLALYAVAGVWLWDRINAPMNVYARQPFVLAGYVLYGVLLGSVAIFDPDPIRRNAAPAFSHARERRDTAAPNHPDASTPAAALTAPPAPDAEPPSLPENPSAPPA